MKGAVIPGRQTMTGAQAIVQCLKKEGIGKVFCVPGESYLPVLDALFEEPDIELITARHEGGAAFMAEGYAKASGKPGVVMATRGVGAGNLTIGVHTAFQDSTPMIVLLGQVHSGFRGREGFQEVDLDRFFSHIAKWSVEIHEAERVPEIMQRAIRVAQTGRPGPVVVSLPEDMLPKEVMASFGPPVRKPRPAPSSDEVKEAIRLLEKAHKPLLIAGGGVKSAGAVQELIHFAEKNAIPVITAFRRHDSFPNNHPFYAGQLGLGTHPLVLKTIRESDLVIAVGTRLSEVTTQDYSIFTAGKKLVHIDIDQEIIGKVFPPDVGMVADAKESLAALAGPDIQPAWQGWGEACHMAYEKASSMLEITDFNKAVIALLQDRLPKGTIITNDAGNFAGWLHSFYRFNEENTYVGPTSGAMGYGMPAAIGAKVACPEKTVVSLSGDGGFMMTVQELETAVRHRIPIISIVFNNRMYGTIRMHQELVYPERVIGTELGAVQFAALARSIGANGYLANSPQEFEQSLMAALKSGRPSVIEINSDPEQIAVSLTIEQIRERSKKKAGNF
ncbi:MAG TPA: thiamine pyrophosphate-dependent enzyme [Bacillaceae bacterium]